MGQLGYERYGVQGGDWGAVIATQMALRHPDSLVGLHLNFIPGQLPPPDGVEPSAEEQAYREFRAHLQATETGYSAIQLTRPQSLAYAQQDSPVGWLAWMLEKYWAWTDHDENLWNTFTRDDVLTTAMLYWLPGRILSAARIYYETLNAAPGSLVAGRVDVPTGYARFPAEPWGPPREVAERSYNLVHYAEPTRGGHFPALEQPEIWSDEVSGFFAALQSSEAATSTEPGLPGCVIGRKVLDSTVSAELQGTRTLGHTHKGVSCDLPWFSVCSSP